MLFRRIAVLVLVLAFGLGAFAGTAQDEAVDPFSVRAIYVSPPDIEREAGWSYEHWAGLEAAGAALGDGVVVEHREDPVPEDESTPVIRESAKRHDMVVATSFGYLKPTLRVAEQFPDTRFVHMSGFETGGLPNVASAFGRIYQARYLTGIIAGHMTETNRVGYVAAFAIPEVIRGINAFALGVRKANPDARVFVNWTGSWFDPQGAERASARALVDQRDVDVLTQHQDSPATQQVAAEEGIWSIGYHSSMEFANPDGHLTAAVWNFAPLYTQLIEEAITGNWESRILWPGFGSLIDGESVVNVAPLNEDVAFPEEAREQLEAARAGLVAGESVFQGPLADQDGNQVLAAGETFTDGELLSMTFFIENVVGDPNPDL